MHVCLHCRQHVGFVRTLNKTKQRFPLAQSEKGFLEQQGNIVSSNATDLIASSQLF